MTDAEGVALTFTAHNVVLPSGAVTLPGAPVIAESGICRAALRDLEVFCGGGPRDRVRVADLGCLEGGYAAEFARAGYDVTGFEVRSDNFACCRYVQDRLGLPNLAFVQADVREVMASSGEWDAVFCCGLLYHLDRPVAFLEQLGAVTRRLLMLQTHYSPQGGSVHEGRNGHWFAEPVSRWSSWGNPRSFWLARQDLLAAVRDAGFDLVFEQADFLDDIAAGGPADRSMFTGVKSRPR